MEIEERRTKKKEMEIRFVCPSCFSRYICTVSELKKGPPICHYCGVPLIMLNNCQRRGRKWKR